MIYKIEVNVLNECGYEEALHGLAKNRKRMNSKEYIEIEENIDKIKLLQRRKQDEN
jgi:hypothetical protein